MVIELKSKPALAAYLKSSIVKIRLRETRLREQDCELQKML